MTASQLREQAEACEKAAKIAFQECDHSHARELQARAQALRRRAREIDAGVTSLWEEPT